MDQYTLWEEKISFFIELGKPLSRAKTIKETIDVVMYQVGQIFQPVNWSMLLKDSKSDDLIFTVVIGNNKDKLQGLKLPKGEGIAGHIFSTGEPLIVSEVENDDRFSRRVDSYTKFKTQSIIGVPLKTDKAVFGVIELINKISGDNFTTVELKVLASIAEYAAIAIERSYYNQSLKKIALYDPLTGLKNKSSFNYTLSNRMELFDRYETPSTLIFINIIRFRKINEVQGHEAGDRLLVTLAEILRKSVRKVDDIFRYDGDRFIVLMPHTVLKDARKVEDRILSHVEYAQSMEEVVPFKLSTDLHPIETKNHKELLDIVHNSVYSAKDTSNYQMYTERIEDNLQTMLDDEKRTMPVEDKKKTLPGKKVSLQGTFVHFNKKEHGTLTVKSISSKGISFETYRAHVIKEEDLLNVVFVLDDRKRSQIKRQVIIQTINKNYYEAFYYNPPPYDKDLGFYLIS